VLAIFAVLGTAMFRGLYGFLAITAPVQGEYLVIEGWMPTFAYREAAKVVLHGHYAKIVCVGVLQEDGLAGGDHREDFGVEQLARFGIPRDLIVTASNSAIQRDRTFHAAVAVRDWMQREGLKVSAMDVVTIGPHARRSRLLYQQALGDDVEVGVFSIHDWRIDPDHWWRSSEGARAVISEAIGYVYAKFFVSVEMFRPMADT
jgi:uncharacterized SAM-binding protein YcdF (DUF218 family)